MSWNSISAVWVKELREALRDRRTLFTTLVLPTVVIPLLVFVAGFVMMKVVNKAKSETARILLIGGADSPLVRTAVVSMPNSLFEQAGPDWRTEVIDKKARLAVEIPEGFDEALRRGEKVQLKLYQYQGEMRSEMTLSEVRQHLNEYRDQIITQRLAIKDLDTRLVHPFEIDAENIAPPEKVGGNMIGGIIPYMFILFCFSGAIYPAIDITAGEKERGTMETILCSPISRLDLVLGKFLTVFTASMTTVFCSLLSMLFTFLAGGFAMGGARAGVEMQAARGLPSGISIDQSGILGVVLLSLPVAAMFAAGLLALALNSKTTKEAQSAITPLAILVVVPAMMGMLPGIELNTKMALVPVLNLALASKELLSGVWSWGSLSLVFVSSIAYAAAALAFCVRQFNRESVVFNN